jgi:signal peptidase I
MKFLFLLYFVSFSPFVIEGPSMEPTFQDDEIIVIDEEYSETGEYMRGDIVVFSFDDAPDFYYVKRIVGMPGERLHIKKDGIYIDDKYGEEVRLDEPYTEDGVSSVLVSEAYRSNYKHTYVIPGDKYFVLGDNRGHSLDSRYFKNPFITKSDIKGKYVFNLTNL